MAECPRPLASSELVDNLNASMHLRAVLTDLFLISEAGRISDSAQISDSTPG